MLFLFSSYVWLKKKGKKRKKEEEEEEEEKKKLGEGFSCYVTGLTVTKW